MMKYLEILIKTARKMRKKAENSGICAKFHSFISFFQSYPDSQDLRRRRRGRGRQALEVPLAGADRRALRPGRALRGAGKLQS